MKKILFISNGHGEDIVAAQIIKELHEKDLEIDVMPVVGKGNVYKDLPVKVIGPKKALPSGGFGLRNYSYLIKDIFSGLPGKIISQIKTLNKNKWSYNLVIGIGDIVPIIYSMLTGCKFIFIGVNKSEYYKKLAFNYTWIEKKLLKDNCELTLARDLKTAKALASYGINAKYVGNPMMDAVQAIGASEYQKIRKGGKKVIGFLPGTREDAYKNIEDFCKIAWQISQVNKKIRFILSRPSTLDRKKLSNIKIPVNIKLSGNFKDVLSRSSVIIGLSGTGNEQAAGIGLPVIAFPGRGAQFNSRFARGQKELLGNALLLLPRRSETIAKEAIALLKNRKRIVSMASAGKKRMGGPGATKRIAEMISRMASR
jgi:hypothetical protein